MDSQNQLWQAYGYDQVNSRAAAAYVGTLQGSKELCIEWLDATAPGWKEDYEAGRAALRPVTVWVITPGKIVEDRAAYQKRMGR